MVPQVRTVVVFADGPGGGNPAPVVLDAAGLTDEQMRRVASESGHESAFVLPAPDDETDLALRFWVPEHEMAMCGHATVGAVWLLAREGRLPRPRVRIATRSGVVEAVVDESGESVEVSQPPGRIEAVDPRHVDTILDVLGISPGELAARPVNATTSRTKTLVPVADEDVLDGLDPYFAAVPELCDTLGSTGLYPYAVTDARAQEFAARQFPRSSGYPEDPATGIAAAALLFGLLDEGLVERSERSVIVRQGRAMGRPSVMRLRLCMGGPVPIGCWLGGPVAYASE